jgi:hypothetical protein
MSNLSEDNLQSILARFSPSPEQTATCQEAVGRILSKDSLIELLPDDMPALERIKIYASEGFAGRNKGTEEGVQKLWQEAFSQSGKGSKK